MHERIMPTKTEDVMIDKLVRARTDHPELTAYASTLCIVVTKTYGGTCAERIAHRRVAESILNRVGIVGKRQARIFNVFETWGIQKTAHYLKRTLRPHTEVGKLLESYYQ